MKQCYSVPANCVVFIDGSLLDGRVGPGFQSSCWAFLVISIDGDYIASPNGIPPRWIETIQGGEL